MASKNLLYALYHLIKANKTKRTKVYHIMKAIRHISKVKK